MGNNKDLLSAYISQHHEFIKSNLENEGNVVGNHYLIELTSILLTIATFSFDKGSEEYKFYHDDQNTTKIRVMALLAVLCKQLMIYRI